MCTSVRKGSHRTNLLKIALVLTKLSQFDYCFMEPMTPFNTCLSFHLLMPLHPQGKIVGGLIKIVSDAAWISTITLSITF